MSEVSDNTVHRSPFSLVEIAEPVDPPGNHNLQLFENADFQLDASTEAYANSPDAFHGSKPPNLGIKHENATHRLICYLKAKGCSNMEIARRTGYTYPWVSQLTRQPWFRLRLVQELREAGQDVVREVIKGAAIDSVYTLIELRDDPTTPKAVRKSASDSLLDRYLGKAVQPIELPPTKMPSTDETRQIEQELKVIDEQLQNYETNPVNASNPV